MGSRGKIIWLTFRVRVHPRVVKQKCNRCKLILFLEIFKTVFASFSQIQFREKVLWTAITLFIFLVCCQVGKIILSNEDNLYSKEPRALCFNRHFTKASITVIFHILDSWIQFTCVFFHCEFPFFRFLYLASCRRILQIHFTGWEWF